MSGIYQRQNKNAGPGQGRIMLLGVLLIALGLFALGQVVVATIASMVILALVMAAGGIGHILLAFTGGGWKRFLLLLAAGVLYLFAGAVTFFNPLLASAVLTLIIAVSLVAAGIARIWFGVEARPASGWVWIVATGGVTLLAGTFIGMTWPINSLWIIGMILSIDLIMQGVSYVAFAFDIRSKARA